MGERSRILNPFHDAFKVGAKRASYVLCFEIIVDEAATSLAESVEFWYPISEFAAIAGLMHQKLANLTED